MINKFALLTGAIAGTLFAASLFISWQMGINSLAGFHKMYAFLPAIFLIVLAAAWWLQQRQGWQLEMKHIIRFSFLSYIVFEVFYFFANYLLFDIIDPSAYPRLVDTLNQQDVAKLRAEGAPEDKIEETIRMGEYAKESLGFGQRMIGIGQALILDFIKSVIIGTIIKQFKR